jgi:ribosome-associated heat shock protein Hsp15
MQVDFEPDARLRIDKWLWCARFFKTRSLAAEAVERGRVTVNGQPCKNSREVKPGDTVVLEAHQQRWEVVVKGVAASRGAAPIAQTLYAEPRKARPGARQTRNGGASSTSRRRRCTGDRPSATGAESTTSRGDGLQPAGAGARLAVMSGLADVLDEVMLEYGLAAAILGVARGNRVGQADEDRHRRERGNQAKGTTGSLCMANLPKGCTKMIHLSAPVIFDIFY